MTIELKPIGEACNLKCKYCYQENLREAGNPTKNKNLEAMLSKAKSLGKDWTIFGGEPLLTPLDELERIFQTCEGSVGIQTAGNLINDELVELFKKYKTHVGFSIDGPDELNDLRITRAKPQSLEATRQATQQSIDNLYRLKEEGVGVSVITTLHKLNGKGKGLEKFLEWGEELSQHDIRHVNIHVLEIENPAQQQEFGMTEEENIEAYLTIAKWLMDRPNLQWAPFNDMLKALQGKGPTYCIWNGCDPLTTSAVQGVDSQGNMGNCGRTCKEGINWLKSDQPGYERYLSLYNSPQELGGCKGCRFFLVCKGECPGQGQEQDWRNKTHYCHTFMALYEFYEERLRAMGITPLSQHPKREQIENIALLQMARGQTPNINQAINTLEGGSHGDEPHGDIPHGDEHGDHYDN